MTVFGAAIDLLFADANLSDSAVWRPRGLPSSEGDAVRVILRAPDATAGFGAARVVVPAMRVDVRASEVANPVKGDLVDMRGRTWRATGDGVLDRDGLVWSLTLEAVA